MLRGTFTSGPGYFILFSTLVGNVHTILIKDSMLRIATPTDIGPQYTCISKHTHVYTYMYMYRSNKKKMSAVFQECPSGVGSLVL